MSDLVIYELHVGTFTISGSFDGVVKHLPALRDLGVSAIEIMPVAEFPGRRNWGYDGVHPYAPHSNYGGPLGLKRLVDAAHETGLAVNSGRRSTAILGAEGNYLEEFARCFRRRRRSSAGEGKRVASPDRSSSSPMRRRSIGSLRRFDQREPPWAAQRV